MSGQNDRDGIDQSTSFWLDRGGGDGDPTTQAWSDERERVAADPADDDWKERHAEDREQAVIAAVDEVRSRDNDRDDWAESKEHRSWFAERYPRTSLKDYIPQMLGWHDRFRTDPINAAEQWTRSWLAQWPVHPTPKKAAPKDEPPADLTRDGREEWQREQDVRDAVRSAGRDRDDENDFTTTADLRALVREKTGMSLAKFLETCRAIDTASLDDPGGVARRFAMHNGAPTTEQHAQDMVSAAQYAQASQAAGAWLDGLEQQGRLPPDYKHLENEIGNVLEFMNANNMRTGDLEADLGNAIDWARDRVIARQQQANAPTQLEGVMRTAGLPSLADHVAKARHASRSVSGAPSTSAGPPRRRDPRMSYEDDLLADVRDAVRG